MLIVLIINTVIAIFAMSYLYDFWLERVVPPDISFLSWINQDNRLHDLGHYLLDFALTMLTAVLFSWCLKGVVWPYFFLCMIPSTLLMLFNEFYNDRHWRMFLGQESWAEIVDCFFDIVTHLLGGIAAVLALILFLG